MKTQKRGRVHLLLMIIIIMSGIFIMASGCTKTKEREDTSFVGSSSSYRQPLKTMFFHDNLEKGF
ncbi:MAG: hypothetical protein LBU04_01610 [Christensenellaceae bacterium]|jgi:hypothetical protein|nr:hypothetical protein [Christensenellaceae bacterium]